MFLRFCKSVFLINLNNVIMKETIKITLTLIALEISQAIECVFECKIIRIILTGVIPLIVVISVTLGLVLGNSMSTKDLFTGGVSFIILIFVLLILIKRRGDWRLEKMLD